MFCCTTTRKEMFRFENGSFVYAKSAEDAIKKLKSTTKIVKSPESESNYYEFDSGVRIAACTPQDAHWYMYLDKREPTFTWNWKREVVEEWE